MALNFKVKDEHFNDFGYQQEIDINAKIANSEPNPGPVSKTNQFFNNSRIYFKIKN
jgi:hypothetical protein